MWDIQKLKHVHIIGIAGTLMGAFATYLKRSGVRVTGSDQNIYPPMSDVLSGASVEVFIGYRAENLSQFAVRPDLVVIGNVIRSDNPEARFAIDHGYDYMSLPEAMERFLLQKTTNYVVSGTHGKTTTTSLLAFILKELGQKSGIEPSYFIGGVPIDLPYSFHVAKIRNGEPFVLEGDEYDTAFWDKVPKFNHYLPDQVILTSIEFDHADIYPDLNAVENAFRGLFQRIRPGGRVVACLDYPVVEKLLKEFPNIEKSTYGESDRCQYRVAGLKTTEAGIEFDVLDHGKPIQKIHFQLPGHHNALNALAVFVLLKLQGYDPTDIASAIAKFRGVKRRQEVRADIGGVLVIDDFAHHPTAVRETLAALKTQYSGRRLVAVFEPRSATSRRRIFQKEYAKAFQSADRIWVAPPYDQSKIEASQQFSSDELVRDLKYAGKQANRMPSVDEGVVLVSKESQSGDVIAVLSNGGFDGFIPKLIEQLKNSLPRLQS
jgi:UDP-N-acetylmuramate: L-alanyl-gamma-D-glutamyl-meso-diaminopimelate ligase